MAQPPCSFIPFPAATSADITAKYLPWRYRRPFLWSGSLSRRPPHGLGRLRSDANSAAFDQANGPAAPEHAAKSTAAEAAAAAAAGILLQLDAGLEENYLAACDDISYGEALEVYGLDSTRVLLILYCCVFM